MFYLLHTHRSSQLALNCATIFRVLVFHFQIQSNVMLLLVWPSMTPSHQHHRLWGQHLAASTSHQLRPLLPQPSPSVSKTGRCSHCESPGTLYWHCAHQLSPGLQHLTVWSWFSSLKVHDIQHERAAFSHRSQHRAPSKLADNGCHLQQKIK